MRWRGVVGRVACAVGAAAGIAFGGTAVYWYLQARRWRLVDPSTSDFYWAKFEFDAAAAVVALIVSAAGVLLLLRDLRSRTDAGK